MKPFCRQQVRRKPTKVGKREEIEKERECVCVCVCDREKEITLNVCFPAGVTNTD